MDDYESRMPIANKVLNPDGSLITFGGELVRGPSESLAATYESFSPMANKFLNPDGSITPLDLGGGSGGGSDPGLAARVTALEIGVAALEETVGTLNDMLQAVLDGSGDCDNSGGGGTVPPVSAGSYEHRQDTASDAWTVEHDLGYRYVSVLVVDDSGRTVWPDIEYTTADEMKLLFSNPVLGTAIIRR